MIKTQGLEISFTGQHIFKDVDVVINKKEKVGFIGRNGSGKSTFLKLILGQLEPDSGEIIIPKIPSYKILDLVNAFSKKPKIKIIGIRPGEKIHELMCPNETHHLTLKFKDHYVIFPSPANFEKKQSFIFNALGEKGIKVKSDFEYSSDKNDKFLSIIEIKKINKEYYSDPV